MGRKKVERKPNSIRANRSVEKTVEKVVEKTVVKKPTPSIPSK
jgi:hypothetical protein